MLLFCRPSDHNQDQGNWKCYKIAKVNHDYKLGRYKRIWLKRVHIISNVKVFTMKDWWMDGLATASQPASQPNEHSWLFRSIRFSYRSKHKRTKSKNRKRIYQFVKTFSEKQNIFDQDPKDSVSCRSSLELGNFPHYWLYHPWCWSERLPKRPWEKVLHSGIPHYLDSCVHRRLCWKCISEWRGRNLHSVPRRQRSQN